MICIPTPNHRKLVEECYPPAKKIAGVENPNSNELGKLVYYAQSKPAKLTKVGKVLNDRAAADSRTASSPGSTATEKGRCGLLITLAILKSLVTECRRDITYIVGSAQSILQHALTAADKAGAHGGRDLELSARASSTFYALTSAIDPSRATMDSESRGLYLDLLKKFGQIAVDQSNDREDRNRYRLIGLGALSGAVSSEAFYTPSFAHQVETIVPSLLANIQASALPLDHLEAEAQKTTAGTPSFSEFVTNARKRPGHRKAPSLSGHIAGEKGPETAQVVSASMGILQAIFRHGDATQIQDAMKPIFKWLDGRGGSSQWSHEEWAILLAKTLCRWTSLPYRFVVLTSFVEYLVEHCDGPSQTKHATLLAIISDILKSKDLTLIGLSTSDTLNNLAGLAVRRVHFDLRDPLLPQIVECIENLAAHIYYAEQLNDIAEELVARIIALTDTGADVAETAKTSHLGRRGSAIPATKSGEEQKLESIRILLFALTRIIIVANSPEGSSGEVHQAVEEQGQTDKQKDKGKDVGPALGITVAGTRSKIQPDVLEPTTALLASHDAPVRLAEAQLLIAYLEREATGLIASSSEAASLAHGVSAAGYVAAISPNLRQDSSSRHDVESGETPLHAVAALDRLHSEKRPSEATDPTNAAVPIDYAALAEVFAGLSRPAYSAAGLLAVVPALFAIDRAAASKLVPDAHSAPIVAHRRRASRLLLAKVWAVIGKEWNISAATKEAESVFSALSDHLPNVPAPHTGLNLPEDIETFPQAGLNGEGSGAASEMFSRSSIVKALSSSERLQEASGLGQETLRAWFERDWSVGIAVDDAAIGASPFADDIGPHPRRPSHVAQGSQANGSFLAAAPVVAGNGAASARSGVHELRQALTSNQTYGSSAKQSTAARDGGVNQLGKGLPSVAGIALHSSGNGENGADGGLASTPVPMSAAERRASKRASRGGLHLSGHANGTTPGALGGASASPTTATGSGGVGGLLDSLGIASATTVEEESRPALVPPHAA